MTWYASQIMTLGDPRMISVVDRNPLFMDHVYHVVNPIRHHWHRPEAKHSAPEAGLLFIRPICDPADPIAEWHGGEFLSWERFEQAPGVDIALTPQKIAARRNTLDPYTLTAVDILRVAKKLHVDTKVPVAFYYGAFWGGDIEAEYAWIFDQSGERFLFRQTAGVPREAHRLWEMDADTETVHDEDVLVRTLRSLGCELPTPYFAPHTREFPWDEHFLKRGRATSQNDGE